jgi:hypothetical protein
MRLRSLSRIVDRQRRLRIALGLEVRVVGRNALRLVRYTTVKKYHYYAIAILFYHFDNQLPGHLMTLSI